MPHSKVFFFAFFAGFLFGPPSVAAPVVPCSQLMASLTAPDESPLFAAGKIYEAQILEGEGASALNASRRDRIKILTNDPALAARIARNFRARGFAAQASPGEVLLALDVLAKVNADLFLEAVTGVLKWPLPVSHDPSKVLAFKRQLASRVVGALSAVNGPQTMRLGDLVARSAWLRNFFAGEANAGRTLLTALKSIPRETAGAPGPIEKIPAFQALAKAWVEPRLAPEGPRLSQLPEMDWAFSRVICVEMSRRLAQADPTAAARFAATAAKLGRAPEAATYLKNERVRALFEEFQVGALP